MGSQANFLASLPEQIRSPNNCWAEELPGVPYSYGYRPSLAAGASFVVLFGFALIYHLTLSMRKKRWVSVALAYGAFVELIGWVGRTWGSQCPYNQHAYLMQIVTLVIAPRLRYGGALIQIFGPESSMLSSRMYTIVFLTCDWVSLVIQVSSIIPPFFFLFRLETPLVQSSLYKTVLAKADLFLPIQAIGAAMAASAQRTRKNPTPGTNAMITGIVFQLATMAVFAGLAVDFLRRISKSSLSPDRSIGGFDNGGVVPKKYYSVLTALFISLVCIVARNLFRVAELAEGWTGHLVLHERYFVALDGFLMVLAVWIFIVLDPARIVDENRDLFTRPADASRIINKGSLEVEEVERGGSDGKGYSVQQQVY
ncbi:hypothetical protein PG993_013060 [Apiospora rasikravindrae]|uniref:Uncharacterized protein n=1 Tax=Apiospora rasikravindrae TaxID=990691 RepID=A0ABR1RWN7_9PEZI